ncbi:hypothetical protein [Nocardioides ganghwensis]|nr:hypothetical protein [Nocardioides ganghwensis]MBD3945843.1 hypothetical protein [Nocardioides ganghwensis]
MRRTTAALGATALLTSLGLVAGPAHADGPEKDREFRVAGAEVDFSVSKDDGRFEVEVDIDDAEPGSRWRVVLWHDGRRYHSKVHRADGDGDVEIEKGRRNTRGADTFKVRVKLVGGAGATRTIRMR